MCLDVYDVTMNAGCVIRSAQYLVFVWQILLFPQKELEESAMELYFSLMKMEFEVRNEVGDVCMVCRCGWCLDVYGVNVCMM